MLFEFEAVFSPLGGEKVQHIKSASAQIESVLIQNTCKTVSCGRKLVYNDQCSNRVIIHRSHLSRSPLTT